LRSKTAPIGGAGLPALLGAGGGVVVYACVFPAGAAAWAAAVCASQHDRPTIVTAIPKRRLIRMDDPLSS
jgi:hypothetical protein